MARAGAEGPASKALEAVERAKNAPFRPAQDNLAAARGLISVSLEYKVILMGSTMDVHKEIDTRGLNCPLPILKAKKALSEMHSGELLKVVATDPGSIRDFQAFAKQTGNELVEQQTLDNEFVHVLRRR